MPHQSTMSNSNTMMNSSRNNTAFSPDIWGSKKTSSNDTWGSSSKNSLSFSSSASLAYKERSKPAPIPKTHEEEFPPLGGVSQAQAQAQPKKSTMDFKTTVQNMVEKVNQQELEAAKAAAANTHYSLQNPYPHYAGSFLNSLQVKIAPIHHREEEEEDDGEFNADLYSTRRRGDKSIW